MEKPKNHPESGIKPLIGIIANSTSPSNRLELIAELGEPHDGFFNPLKFSFKEFLGEIIPLDIQPHDIFHKSGMAKGKTAMLNAVKYLAEKGAKVICFTAATKRLPGKSDQEVKSLYPDIIFSIGDNLTSVSSLLLIDRILSLPGKINPEKDQVVVLGWGILGQKTIETLLAKNFQKITLVSEQKISGLDQRVQVIDSPNNLPTQIKLLMSCTHKYKDEIDPEKLWECLHPKAIILDVAIPQGISPKVHSHLPATTSLFHSGNFFLDDVKYNFPPSILSFPLVGFWFGCFTEAIILNIAQDAGEDLEKFNFFEINPEAQSMLRGYLEQEKVSLPLVNLFKPEKMEFIPL
ncbi:MAG: hypothetical protein WCW61_01890 [Patescibacteria group bacterium]|jgi:hypothetical protein